MFINNVINIATVPQLHVTIIVYYNTIINEVLNVLFKKKTHLKDKCLKTVFDRDWNSLVSLPQYPLEVTCLLRTPIAFGSLQKTFGMSF